MQLRLMLTSLLWLSIKCFAQESSSIDFIIKNLGINVDGHFNSFSITTTFNASNHLESIEGEIMVNSIETGIDNRDDHLLEDDYFNAHKHPKITLKSTEIYKNTFNTYTVKANLNIKGKTKQITIPVSVLASDTNKKIVSEFEINRRDFDIGGGSFVMSKTVKIKVLYIENL